MQEFVLFPFGCRPLVANKKERCGCDGQQASPVVLLYLVATILLRYVADVVVANFVVVVVIVVRGVVLFECVRYTVPSNDGRYALLEFRS
jgi:hypothetical protein